jgi:hypothetical protein
VREGYVWEGLQLNKQEECTRLNVKNKTTILGHKFTEKEGERGHSKPTTALNKWSIFYIPPIDRLTKKLLQKSYYTKQYRAPSMLRQCVPAFPQTLCPPKTSKDQSTQRREWARPAPKSACRTPAGSRAWSTHSAMNAAHPAVALH